MKKQAIISDCSKYRYMLSRIWDDSLPRCMFIGLNPSTADAEIDDPTINKCVTYAKSWGYGTLLMGNLFALRSTDPSQLYNTDNPVGDENNMWLEKLASESGLIIVAWGNHGSYQDRYKEVVNIINKDLYCLNVNKTGQPTHPLYQKNDLKPLQYHI